jgi:hypothetical protein
MKILISLILISGSCFAQRYEVTHRGHAYVYEKSSEAVSFSGERLKASLPIKACSRTMLEALDGKFQKSLTVRTASEQGSVSVATESEKFRVPAGRKEGKYLIGFPDHFAKAILMQKQLCPQR